MSDKLTTGTILFSKDLVFQSDANASSTYQDFEEVNDFYRNNLLPISLFNREFASTEERGTTEASEGEPFFGTHIGEAVKTIRSLMRK